eukprot:SAG11_NODE_1268_length_5342_cov_1.710853_1_plen_55_part_00
MHDLNNTAMSTSRSFLRVMLQLAVRLLLLLLLLCMTPQPYCVRMSQRIFACSFC